MKSALFLFILLIAFGIFPESASASATVVYRQTFGNDSGDNLTLDQARTQISSVNWLAYANDGVSANNLPTVVVSPLGGSPVGAENIGIGESSSASLGYLATQLGTGLDRLLVFTREFPFDPADYNDALAFDWFTGNAQSGYATRIAVEIGGQWYVSTNRFYPPNIGSASNFPAQGRNLQFFFDRDSHLWRELDLVADNRMEVAEVTLTNPLPVGEISGVGFFIEREGASSGWVRHDTLSIVAQPSLLPSQWRSILYPENWTPPTLEDNFYTDKILQDYSHAGYRMSDVPIPFVEGPVFDVSQSPYNADPTGATDSTAAIQQAIDDAGNAGGGVVYLPAGTYTISPIGSGAILRITQSGVVIRGDGPGQTFLLNTAYQMRGRRVIHAFAPSSASWTSNNTPSVPLANDLMGPTREIPVLDTSIFEVGDNVIIRNTITEDWIDEHNEPNWSGFTSSLSGIAYARTIQAIDHQNNVLIVDIPTRYALKIRDGARVHRAIRPLSEIGLEDFSIGNVQHPATSGWGNEDYTVQGRAAYDVHGTYLVEFQRVENSWMRRIHSFRPPQNSLNAHMLSNGVRLAHARLITLESVHMQRAQYGGGGGNGYMFRMSGASDNLLVNCLSSNNRHGFVFSGMAAHGNVIHDSVDRTTRWAASMTPSGSGSDHHMHFSHSNLIDASTVIDSFFDARYRPFGSHPQHNLTASHSTFWNTIGLGTDYDFSVRTEQSRYGYAIGTQGRVTNVRTNSTRPQTLPQDHVEGVGSAYTLFPQSLYRSQLHRRQNRIEMFPLGRSRELPQSIVPMEVHLEIGSALGMVNDQLDFDWEILGDPAGAFFQNPNVLDSSLVMPGPGSREVRLRISRDGQLLDEITFEVALDPISTQPTFSDMQFIEPIGDSFVSEAQPNTNFASEPELLGRASDLSNPREVYIQFNLSNLPASADEIGVGNLYLQKLPNGTAHLGQLWVLEDSDWTEQNITWNNRPTAGQALFFAPLPQVALTDDFSSGTRLTQELPLQSKWFTGGGSSALEAGSDLEQNFFLRLFRQSSSGESTGAITYFTDSFLLGIGQGQGIQVTMNFSVEGAVDNSNRFWIGLFNSRNFRIDADGFVREFDESRFFSNDRFVHYSGYEASMNLFQDPDSETIGARIRRRPPTHGNTRLLTATGSTALGSANPEGMSGMRMNPEEIYTLQFTLHRTLSGGQVNATVTVSGGDLEETQMMSASDPSVVETAFDAFAVWTSRFGSETAFLDSVTIHDITVQHLPEPAGELWSDSGHAGPRLFDLGQLVADRLRAGDSTLSLRLTIEEQQDTSAIISYASKEHPEEMWRPRLEVSYAEFLSYDLWAEQTGIPLGERDPLLDRFRRGNPNLLSFATGIDAEFPSGPKPAVWVEGNELRFQVPWKRGLSGAAFFIGEVSEDLAEWTPIPLNIWNETLLGEGRLLYEATLPLDDELTARFFRLRFSKD